jgi:hypothetical protein
MVLSFANSAFLKKAPGPTFALVAPQLTERLLEQIRAIQALVSTQQILHGEFQRRCEPYFLPLFTHSITAVSQIYYHFSFPLEAGCFSATIVRIYRRATGAETPLSI